MSIRTVLVVVLALISGGSAAVGVNSALLKGAAAPKPAPIVAVVVAAADIPRGAVLSSGVLRIPKWPASLAPAGTLPELEAAVDRAALTSFVAGEPILASKVAEGGLGAAALVRPGLRAYAIHTPTASSGVAGFIMPGNHVDVLLTVTGRHEQHAGGGLTTTLLQNVEILAAGQRLDQSDPSQAKLQSVTLLVTPDMATKLTLAQTVGTLNLTLRNDSDSTVAETSPITMNDLRFLQEAMQSEEEPVDEPDPPEPIVFQPPAKPEIAKPVARILTLRGNSAGVVRISH